MASSKLSATIILFSLLFYIITFSSACGPCEQPKKPKPTPTPKFPAPYPHCPKDTLKLGACADLLGGVANVVLGTPVSSKCCALLGGLTDLEAAVCLCTAIKANVLGINLNVPITLSLLVSSCHKSIPSGFKCA